MKNMFSIKNKVILLTGAFGFIGKALAHELLNQEAKVILCGHSLNKIERYKNEFIKKYKADNFLIYQLDITKEETIDDCIKKAIRKFKKIDILINNASIDSKVESLNNKRFDDYPFEQIERLIDTNIKGTVKVSQKICKQFVKQGFGKIINVGSIYSLIAPNNKLYKFDNIQSYKNPGYLISKSFIPNFTRFIASQYNNIQCIAIYFHGVENNQSKEFLTNFKSISLHNSDMASLKDIIKAFIFLCTENNYLNGTGLLLDNGWTCI